MRFYRVGNKRRVSAHGVVVPGNLERPVVGCDDLDLAERLTAEGLLREYDMLVLRPCSWDAAYQVVWFDVAGGLGDAVMALPFVREMAKRWTVYLHNVAHVWTERIYREFCPFVRFDVPPPWSRRVVLRAEDMRLDPAEHRNVNRFDDFARRLGVRPRDWHPSLHLRADGVERARRRLRSMGALNGRPRIALALNAHNVQRTMHRDRQRALIAALVRAGADVHVFHATQTVGNSPHVYDHGGGDLVDNVYLASLMDGAIVVDCGFAHVLAALRVPLVALMGPVAVGARFRHYRGLVVELEGRCEKAPCWSRRKWGSYDCSSFGRCLDYEPGYLIDTLKEVCPW